MHTAYLESEAYSCKLNISSQVLSSYSSCLSRLIFALESASSTPRCCCVSVCCCCMLGEKLSACRLEGLPSKVTSFSCIRSAIVCREEWMVMQHVVRNRKKLIYEADKHFSYLLIFLCNYSTGRKNKIKLNLQMCISLVQKQSDECGHVPQNRPHLVWVHFIRLQPLQIQHVLLTVGQL